MLHLRNWSAGMTRAGRLLFGALVVQLMVSIPGVAGEMMDSTQYQSYVRLRRAMAEMELWQGETPRSLLMLEKELSKSWIAGDSRAAMGYLDQAQEYVNKYTGLDAYGAAAIDDIPNAPELMTITVQESGIAIDPSTPSITLAPGVVKIYRVSVINGTSDQSTVRIESPDLFRAGRQVTVPVGQQLAFTWPVRTLAVYPFKADLAIFADDRKQDFSIAVQPKPDPRKPLVGLAIHIPGYGRYERLRAWGKGKPNPEEVKRHPELLRPTRLQEVSPDLQAEVRIHYLSLRAGNCEIYRLPGDWDFVELSRDKYSWEYVDSNIRDVEQLTRAIPVLYLGYEPWWVKETRNSNGSMGLKDIRNQDLVGKYRQYIRQMGEHTGDRVHWFELWNEPIIYWFYDEKEVPSGPRYVSQYGNLLRSAISLSVEELHQDVSDSWVISPGFVDQDMFSSSWTMLKYLIDNGMLDQVNALCVHKYPLGVGVAPPPGKSSLPWVELDYITDESALLHELQKRGKEDMPLWCTELGGFGLDRLDGSAYLRMGTLMAFQGFKGLHFTSQPVALDLLQEAVAGADPVEWGPCKKMDSYHSGVVMKTFTRGPEDIIVVWNNTDQTQSIRFVQAESQVSPKLLMVQEYSEPLGGPSQRSVAYTQDDLDKFFQKSFNLGRLEWKAFIVIPNGNNGFGWLSQVEGVGPDPRMEGIERLWHEVRLVQRDVFAGEIGSSGDQMAFKDAYKTFRRSWMEGEISAAQNALQTMADIGRRARR